MIVEARKNSAGTSEVNLVSSSTDWSQVADPNFPELRGTVMNFTNNTFMGYYTGVSSYEILQIENDFHYVRFYDAVNPVVACYQIFTTTQPGSEVFNSTFNNLFWQMNLIPMAHQTLPNGLTI